MTLTAPTAPRDRVHHERERIRALLARERPELARRVVAGPSGALIVPLPDGRSLEVGRLPRRGATRWVIVVPQGDRVRVREPRSIPALVAAVLEELGAAGPSRVATVGP